MLQITPNHLYAVPGWSFHPSKEHCFSSDLFIFETRVFFLPVFVLEWQTWRPSVGWASYPFQVTSLSVNEFFSDGFAVFGDLQIASFTCKQLEVINATTPTILFHKRSKTKKRKEMMENSEHPQMGAAHCIQFHYVTVT